MQLELVMQDFVQTEVNIGCLKGLIWSAQANCLWYLESLGFSNSLLLHEANKKIAEILNLICSDSLCSSRYIRGYFNVQFAYVYFNPLIPPFKFERAYSSVIILLFASVLIPPFKVERAYPPLFKRAYPLGYAYSVTRGFICRASLFGEEKDSHEVSFVFNLFK